MKPIDSLYDALGTMLDLVQYRRLLNGLELSDEEMRAFRQCLNVHKRSPAP